MIARGVDDLQDIFGGRGLLLNASLVRASRAFSIAITAWAAKFCSSAISLSGERSDFLAESAITPSSIIVFPQRHERTVRVPADSTKARPTSLPIVASSS